MRFFSLASSSRAGSAYLIEGGDGTRVLVDCGTGIRRLESGLRREGVEPGGLAGVLVTHGHSDHVAALRLRNPFTVKHRVPLYASGRVLDSLLAWDGWVGGCGRLAAGENHAVQPQRPFRVGGLEVRAFLKPHDCEDPLGFLIDDGESRIAVVTDLGCVPAEMVALLRDSTYLIFESNHDVDMELGSDRPVELIRRVLGDRGHLSNEQAAEALARIVGPGTKMVLLAHLSDECNTPELAYGAVAARLEEAGYRDGLGVAPLFSPSRVFSAAHAPRLAGEAVAL
ncbi:MAG: MBL fold metallo-hydrolase [Bacillota bacterium]|jgi:phosphoribosyl 1,2-cyclic phosphodiesterase